MIYNFDEIIDRSNTNCEKYDSRERIFKNPDLIPLWVADTDFKTPNFIVEAVKKRAAHEIYGYPIIPNSFYNSIIGWLQRRHNWQVEKDWIHYSPNVVIGLASLVLSLTKPGDKIIVQPPVYFPFFHVVKGNGRVMVENQLKKVNGRYTFDFDDLISKIDKDTKLLLLCNPHNPGGMVWSRDELNQLGQICIDNNIIVISDEIHSDLIYNGYKHIPFASISEAFSANCITAMSASKTFNIAGLSSSFLIISNNQLARQYEKFMQATHISSGNFFGLVATQAAYENGDDWLLQLLAYLEGNRQLLSSYLTMHLPKVKLMQPEGTYLAWIDLTELSISAQEAFDKLVKAGIGLSPGHLFGLGGDNYVRLNIGCPRSVLSKALEIMALTLKDL